MVLGPKTICISGKIYTVSGGKCICISNCELWLLENDTILAFWDKLYMFREVFFNLILDGSEMEKVPGC